jgi:hypothetical protein
MEPRVAFCNSKISKRIVRIDIDNWREMGDTHDSIPVRIKSIISLLKLPGH